MTTYDTRESPDETTLFSYHDLDPPTLADVYEARRVVGRYLPRTPLVRSEYLSAELDADVYLKREDTLPTGAFKVRGGINLCATLDEEFTDPGLVAASTGNHGQSVAYAGRAFDIPVLVAVPGDPNPDKVAAMERFGAEVHPHGRDYDAAREWAEEQAREHGYRYVHSANEPKLVAGVGTAGLEVVEELPAVDTLICPVGGGSSAAGYCLTVGQTTDADVIGVQSENASAMYHAWAEGHLRPREDAETYAEGLQSRVPFALTTRLLRDHLAEMVLVGDDRIREAVEAMLREEHLLLEGAACASVAAALERREELAGQTVVLQISGKNLATSKLREVLCGDGD
ncbi:threonine ammonia-lyase [Halogeometricum limi]|uniref:Threonine dehydratase n=1 Tax=Halogeometricum limi TaxID=555875 RepID=A0A1I6IE60_9EURY|nr:threonine/serine dehydratase [Halogeometricum limi]SFR64986.1 threonine dehydratase [Halogeometricum limi]